MQYMKFFLLTSLLFLSLQFAWANERNLAQTAEYQAFKPYLQKIFSPEISNNDWRERLVILDYEGSFQNQAIFIRRVGRFGDELEIKTCHFTLIVPEWCVLIYLQELEKQEFRQKNTFFV
jgi:hypothetical protein